MRSQIYQGEIDIGYYFQKSETPSDKMIVVIPNGHTRKGNYDFIMTLREFTGSHRLFLANDWELRKGFYLIKDGDFIIERTIISFINKFCEEENIKQVIFIGFCGSTVPAFYLSQKYGYDAILTAINYYYAICREGTRRSKAPVTPFYRAKMINNYQGKNGIMDFEKFYDIEVPKYTGWNLEKILNIHRNLLKSLVSTKQKRGKIWLFAAPSEDVWLIEKDEMIPDFDKYGVDYEVHMSETDFDHLGLTPPFIKFFTQKLKELRYS